MSNHFHIVVRIDRDRAAQWTREAVIQRWQTLFTAPVLVNRWLAGEAFSDAELKVLDTLVEQWRGRLCDLSWFMRCLNEPIARLANAEDGCTGRFWEGRFRSQALLDEVALLACMAYVDLNPIRAGMATTPEGSDFTALQERLGIEPGINQHPEKADTLGLTEAPLLPFAGSHRQSNPEACIPYAFADYLELVDWTGRAVHEKKRGHIPESMPAILTRLNIAPSQWLSAAGAIEQQFYYAIGPVGKLEEFRARLKRRWLQGSRACRALYQPPPCPA